MGEIIRLEDIYYSYPNSSDKAVNGISLSIKEGEYLAVVGPNGSGKSTLIRMINGLIRADSGTIAIGPLILDQTTLWEVRRKVAMVFQNPDNQLVAARVEDEIAFGPENLGLPPAEIRARVDEIMLLLNLTHLSQHPPHMLSGGQKQRLAIAGALAMGPQVIILDEPTSMLDPQGRQDFLTLLDSLNQQGITIIHVTHHGDEAALARRVVALNKGVIVGDGSPKELFYGQSELDQLGVGMPKVVTIVKGLKENGIHVPDGILTINELVEWLCSLN